LASKKYYTSRREVVELSQSFTVETSEFKFSDVAIAKTHLYPGANTDSVAELAMSLESNHTANAALLIGRRILLVEDDQELAAEISAYFRTRAHEVDHAATGSQGAANPASRIFRQPAGAGYHPRYADGECVEVSVRSTDQRRWYPYWRASR
jgi:hypothetical protein